MTTLTTFTTQENAEAYLVKSGFKHAGDGVWKYGLTKYRAYLGEYKNVRRSGDIRTGAESTNNGYHVSYWPEFPPDKAHQSLREQIGGMAYQ